jgi:hypothetical protein
LAFALGVLLMSMGVAMFPRRGGWR